MAVPHVFVEIGARDCVALARWWATALGWYVVGGGPDALIVRPDGARTSAVSGILVRRADSLGRGKNRVHLDLASDSADHQRAIVRSLVASGATPADVGQGDVPWAVLADPEGNLLCVLEPRSRHAGRGPLAAVVVDAPAPEATARSLREMTGWTASREVHGVTLRHPGDLLPDIDVVHVADEPSASDHVRLVAPGAGLRPLESPHDSRVRRGDPRRGEILSAHADALARGVPTYTDPATGYAVFTARSLLDRVQCCAAGCRHCPYV